MPGAALVSSPPEVVEHALTYCHPLDVHSFALTCHFAYDVVYGPASLHLWRLLYLLYPFDDPRKNLKARHDPEFMSNFNWKLELQRRIFASRPPPYNATNESRNVLKYKLETYISVVQAASPSPDNGGNEQSHDLRWLNTILADFEGCRLSPLCVDVKLLQLLARLRSSFALSLLHRLPLSAISDSRRIESRCYVYDWRNYRYDGPFLCDGQVNWIHIEAIIIVIRRNLLAFPHLPLSPPLGLHAARAYSAPATLASEQTDWAGVAGVWARCVCFVDYRLLQGKLPSLSLRCYKLIPPTLPTPAEFNHSVANARPPQPFFEDRPNAEATRLFKLELRLLRRYGPIAANASPYPPLRFVGTPKGVNSSHASVEGTVMMGADGVVRWQFTSIYDSVTKWCSEGVQLGNIASALGVVGTWSGGQRLPGEPVGPFWMWRVRDDELSSFN